MVTGKVVRMEQRIDFPNIGIHLSGVGNHITVHGFRIAYYGITIGVAILAGIFIAAAEARRTGQNPEDYYDFAIYAVIVSIIGARIYYVAFFWDVYKDNLKSILNLREGGLAIYGGVIAAIIFVFLYAKVKKMPAAVIFDTAGLGLVAGQAIGRWGNFFNREAFGEYTDGLLAMRLPVSAVRNSADITALMKQHMETIDGISCIQVHPTFLYESLWCLGVLGFLLLYRRHKRFQGEVFLMYLSGYGLGRVWIEGLRTDQLLIPGTSLPVSQILAGTLAVLSSALILVLRSRIPSGSGRSYRG